MNLFDAEEKVAANGAVNYREIVGYPGYRVGDDGSVWTKKNGRWGFGDTWRRLKPALGGRGKGHWFVGLYADRSRRLFYVHVLVLTAFRGPCPVGLQGCHNNGNRDDNRLTNLRWDTQSSNSVDAIKHGVKPSGESHNWTRHSDEKVGEVRRMRAKGLSITQVSRITGVPKTSVWSITTGNSRKEYQ